MPLGGNAVAVPGKIVARGRFESPRGRRNVARMERSEIRGWPCEIKSASIAGEVVRARRMALRRQSRARANRPPARDRARPCGTARSCAPPHRSDARTRCWRSAGSSRLDLVLVELQHALGRTHVHVGEAQVSEPRQRRWHGGLRGRGCRAPWRRPPACRRDSSRPASRAAPSRPRHSGPRRPAPAPVRACGLGGTAAAWRRPFRYRRRASRSRRCPPCSW